MRSKKVHRNDERPEEMDEYPVLNHEQEHIKQWLKQVRLKKQFIGGVDESDVWKKIAELNDMYEAAISAERARYDAMLKEAVGIQAKQLARQMYNHAVQARRQEKAGVK